MIDEEISNYKIRVPSHMEVTTISNIWKFVQVALPKLPDKFENADVINIKDFPLNNVNTVSRTLAYFKYLGILTEERTQEKKGEKLVSRQYFNLTEQGKELKTTSIVEPENLYNKWKQVLRESELYKAIITNEEFVRYNHLSKITLRKLLTESFSKKVINIKERVDKAEDYIIKFLREVELFTFDGNVIKQMAETKGEIKDGIKKEKENGKDMDEKEEEIEKFRRKSEEKKYPKDEFYHVKTDEYELRVRYDELAIEMLEDQIKIARKKLNSFKKQEQKSQELESKEEIAENKEETDESIIEDVER